MQNGHLLLCQSHLFGVENIAIFYSLILHKVGKTLALHPSHIENIGLIEVMGLAVLPSRLKGELTALAEALAAGKDIAADEALSKHAPWAEELKKQYTFTGENALDILLRETGKVFTAVLEDAGVYKNDATGQNGFLRFVDAVNRK